MLQGDDIERRKDKVGWWQKKERNGYALCHCRLQLCIREAGVSGGGRRQTWPPRGRPPVLPRCMMRQQRSARVIRDAAAWALGVDSPTNHQPRQDRASHGRAGPLVSAFLCCCCCCCCAGSCRVRRRRRLPATSQAAAPPRGRLLGPAPTPA